MNTILIYLFYYAGDLISRVLDLFPDWKWLEKPTYVLYRAYSWLMQNSADLDKEEKIWIHRKEGETEEECEERGRKRWPGKYL